MSHAPPRRLLRLWAPSAHRVRTRSCCQEVHEAGRASPAPSLGRQRRTCRPTCRRSSCHPTLGPAQRDNGRLGLLSKPHPAPRSSGAAARRCDSGATRGREGARQPLRAAPRAARSGCGAKRGRRRAREVTCACVVRFSPSCSAFICRSSCNSFQLHSSVSAAKKGERQVVRGGNNGTG